MGKLAEDDTHLIGRTAAYFGAVATTYQQQRTNEVWANHPSNVGNAVNQCNPCSSRCALQEGCRVAVQDAIWRPGKSRH